MKKLKHESLLSVNDSSGTIYTGGNQYWFPKEGFLPGGACGATAASNVLAYILRSNPALYKIAEAAGLSGLAEPIEKSDLGQQALQSQERSTPENFAPNTKEGYLDFMKKVYKYLYPRFGGLMADHFQEGMKSLSDEYGLPLEAECLKVPINNTKRPSVSDALNFVLSSLDADIPVAFLVLSSGNASNLDTWHWVTILAYNEETKETCILDNGSILWTNLETWLDTSIMGGAFVRMIYSPE